jgi:hypothetical protein
MNRATHGRVEDDSQILLLEFSDLQGLAYGREGVVFYPHNMQV